MKGLPRPTWLGASSEGSTTATGRHQGLAQSTCILEAHSKISGTKHKAFEASGPAVCDKQKKYESIFFLSV